MQHTTMAMHPDFFVVETVFKSFNPDEGFLGAEPFGSGHINDTYRIFVKGATTPRYVLQRINTSVFPNIAQLSGNIHRVTEHLKAKASVETLLVVPTLYKNLQGNYWVEDNNGGCWRLMDYVPESLSYDLATHTQLPFEAGKAYGWFITNLVDLPYPPLFSVIPRFHDLPFRLEELDEAVRVNYQGRTQQQFDLLNFYYDRREPLLAFNSMVIKGEIPYRTTHNDTKINNILFDTANKALAVIDLDTVMPGIVHYDYGDAVRTICATALEDEEDLSRVGVNLEFLDAFTKGFLGHTATTLNRTELQTLPIAPLLMTYLMGIRFLADYLRGDTYYKIKHPLHNLNRAMNQAALIVDLERKNDTIRHIIESHSELLAH